MKRAAYTLLPLLVASAAFAQNNQNPNQPQPEEPAAAEPAIPAPDPLDPEAQRLVDMLAGSWRMVEPIRGEDEHMVVHLAPFVSPTLGHVIYVESAREGDPWTATRQSLFKVYRFGDQLRLRTLDFRTTENRKWEHLIGLWAAPDLIPGESVKAEDTIATMDINVQATRGGGGGGGGFSGETPCPYPTREYGAVQMSSALEVSRDRIVTKDTFYGEDGQVVAGAGATGAASGTEWRRYDSAVEVRRDDSGLVQVIMKEAEDDVTPVEGANVYVHYSGWLESGQMFDSSRARPAYRFVYPGMFIEGWNMAIADMGTGSRRKLIIPSELGYGDREDIRQIPPNSTLIFDVEMLKIELPETQEGEGGENPDQPGGADNSGSATDTGGG